MKVHELIAELQKFDQQTDIYIPCPHCCGPPAIDKLTNSDVHDNGDHVYLGSAVGDCLMDTHQRNGTEEETDHTDLKKPEPKPTVASNYVS